VALEHPRVRIYGYMDGRVLLQDSRWVVGRGLGTIYRFAPIPAIVISDFALTPYLVSYPWSRLRDPESICQKTNELEAAAVIFAFVLRCWVFAAGLQWAVGRTEELVWDEPPSCSCQFSP
jgi:hypothetical protein